jgi:phosphate transport system permease protein
MNTTDKKMSSRRRNNRFFKGTIIALNIAAVVPLLIILYYIVVMGAGALSFNFIFNAAKPVGEPGGGILNAIIGTLLVIGIACITSIPLGVAAGIGLSETTHGRITYFTRLCTDILQGTPSIVIGIIAYMWIVRPLGKFSAFAGGLALGIMMIPIIVRSTEETLKLIPYNIKEASLALGVPYYRTILSIILPSAMGGIITGIILAIARIAGETAPLLFTAFGNPKVEFNVFKPVNTIPLLIFNYASSPYPDWHQQAWGASFVLLIIIIIMNILAKILSRKWKT